MSKLTPVDNDDTENVFSNNSLAGTSTRKLQFDVRNPLNLVQEDGNSDNDDKNSNDEENILLEQDIEGSRPKMRRNNVRLDFDSDSSDDGQTRREKELEKQLKARDDSGDDDMFSDDDDNNKPEELNTDSAADNSLKLLNMDHFEKQSGIEASHGNEARDLEDDDEEEGTEQNVDINYFVNPDGERAIPVSHHSKTQEPKLEAFHLRTDMEEGNFDADGNFIRNTADSSAHQDQWLEGVSKKQMKKARLAHAQREAKETENSSQGFVPIPDLMIRLVELLEIGENALEALQRLNSEKKKPRKTRTNKFRKDLPAETIEENEESVAKEAKRKSNIEDISHYADSLLQRGVGSIYDMSREEILRDYEKKTGVAYSLKRKRSSSPEPEPEPDRARELDIGADLQAKDISHVQWEFVWEGSDELHGPYDTITMKSWIEHDYFDSRVKVRQIGTSDFVQFDLVKF